MSESSHSSPDDLLLAQRTHYQLVHKLMGMLPPPLDNTPEARAARDHAAIAQAAAMLPVGDEEMQLAVHCVAARARAEEALCTIARCNNYEWIVKLDKQFALMERTANSNRSLLLRLQARRSKRQADDGTAQADTWAQHIATQQMQQALAQTQAPKAAEAEADAPEPVAPAEPPQPQAPAEQPRDLAAEAARYAADHPRQARLIRSHGGVPRWADFPAPDAALLAEIVRDGAAEQQLAAAAD